MLLSEVSEKMTRQVEKPDKGFFQNDFAIISQCKTSPSVRFFIASNISGDKEISSYHSIHLMKLFYPFRWINVFVYFRRKILDLVGNTI